MASEAAVTIIIKAKNDAAKVLASVQGQLQSFGQTATRLGKSLSMGVTMPLVGMATAAVKTASDFESQMRIMEIAARDSGISIDTLSDYALKMGAETVFSASEAADAMTGLFKAGMDATAVMGDMTGQSGALAAAMDLAAASDLSLAQAADAVTIAMATFGIETEGAAKIADIFVQAADASVAEVGELTAAMQNVGPTAAAFGWSLEDVNVALALLSERGIRGSEAGTALKSMMTMLLKPTDKVTDTLAALGVNLYDASGHMYALDEIIGQLGPAMAGLSEEQRNVAIQTLAGTYGMKAMHTLLAEGVIGWNEMEDAIAKAATAQEIADVRMDTFAGTVEGLKGSLETLLITIGTPLIEDFLRPFAERATEIINKLQEMSPATLDWAIKIGMVAAAAGPVLVILGFLATALSALLSPIGLAIALVAGLALAWTTDFMGIRQVTESVFARIQEVIQTVLGVVVPFIQEQIGIVVAWFQEKWALIQPIVETAFSAIQTVVETALGAVQAIVERVLEGIRAFWEEHGAEILAEAEYVWQGVLSVVQTIIPPIRAFIEEQISNIVAWVQENLPLIRETWDTILNAVQTTTETVLNVVWTIIQTVLNQIRAFWDDHGQQIMSIVEAAWNIIKTTIETVINVVLGIIKTVMQLITGDWEGAWETIKETASTVWEAIKTIVDEAINIAKNTIDVAMTTIQALWDRIWEAIKTKLGEIWDAMKTAVETKALEIFTAIETWIGDCVTAITSTVEDFKEAGKAIIGGLISGAKAKAQAMVDAVVGVITDALNAAKALLGISCPDPSPVFGELGIAMGEGVAMGIGKAQARALDAMENMQRQIQAAMARAVMPAPTLALAGARARPGAMAAGLAVAGPTAAAGPVARDARGTGRPIVFEIPIILDGREIARVVDERLADRLRAEGITI